MVPCQVTASLRSSRREQIELFLEQILVVGQLDSRTDGKDSVKEPRPSVTSARPFETALSVEKRWNTRIGSSDDSTVTAEPSQIRLRAPGDGGEHHVGRGDREVGPMMLADAEGIDAGLVGQHAFLDHVADDLGVRARRCRPAPR